MLHAGIASISWRMLSSEHGIGLAVNLNKPRGDDHVYTSRRAPHFDVPTGAAASWRDRTKLAALFEEIQNHAKLDD